MNENPIKTVTDTLAEMTTRAMEAEDQLDKVRKSAEEYFNSYLAEYNKGADLKAKLDAETELRERAQQALREEKEAHAETWRKVEELIVRAVDAGINRESLERMIYGPDALEEIREGGAGDAE